MPGQTAHALPYPLGTDPISQGDDTITSLAQAVDRVMGLGAGTVSIVFNNVATATVAVTFPAGRFKSIPAALATAQDSSTIITSVTAVTATGCTVTGRTYNGTALTATVAANWIALEKV
jgi:hypothetical protein